MHWVPLKTIDQHFSMEVDLAVVSSHLKLEVLDAPVDISLGEWMGIC